MIKIRHSIAQAVKREAGRVDSLAPLMNSDPIDDFRRRWLAFSRGSWASIPIHVDKDGTLTTGVSRTTSMVSVMTHGGTREYEPRYKDLPRLQAQAALGCVARKHNFAYMIAYTYDFVGRSKHPERVAHRYGMSVRQLHRLVREFWEALYNQCQGYFPGEEPEEG